MKKQRTLFIADYLLTPDKRIDNAAVLCEADRIMALGGESSFTLEPGVEEVRLPGAYMTPGFIDSHIHGAGGFDCSSVTLSPNPIDAMSRLLAERGVTAFIPTVVADRRERMLENLQALAALLDQPVSGAVPLGINVEGPFINPKKKGAQDADSILPIDLGFADELIAAGGGKIKLMTFAPELKGAEALVERLCAAGVRPSMGHSVADDRQTLRAIDAGARNCTHLFNGMPPMHQRDLTLSNVALTDNRVTVEIIIDGRHVHPRMVDLACRCKPARQIIGISDCTMAAGMPDGEYRPRHPASLRRCVGGFVGPQSARPHLCHAERSKRSPYPTRQFPTKRFLAALGMTARSSASTARRYVGKCMHPRQQGERQKPKPISHQAPERKRGGAAGDAAAF